MPQLNYKQPEDFNSLIELLDFFKDEPVAIEYLQSRRLEGRVRCPHCGHNKVYKFSDEKRFKCSSCREQFTAKVETIFEDSKILFRYNTRRMV